jgi:hypothetical protein
MKAILVSLGILLLVIGLIMGLTLVFFAQVELTLISLLTNILLHVHIFQIELIIAISIMVVGCSLVFLGLYNPNKANREEPVAKTDEKIWTAERVKKSKELINENDFEESRRCLLTSYHSYVQTHAGYIIGLIIGLFAVIATFHDFLINGFWGTFAFIFLILAILGTSAYMTLRIFYWTAYANVANGISIDNALDYFNNYNKNKKDKKLVYFSKAPNTAIIQHAIVEQLQIDFNRSPWYYRNLVLRNIRPPTEDTSSNS